MDSVRLSEEEMEIAAQVGSRRRIRAQVYGWNDKHGYDGSKGWDVDIEGAAAEEAFCRYRGLYWGGHIDTFKAADVGDNIQVRCTELEDGCLILRGEDNPEHFKKE